jgi:hypothetical protein
MSTRHVRLCTVVVGCLAIGFCTGCNRGGNPAASASGVSEASGSSGSASPAGSQRNLPTASIGSQNAEEPDQKFVEPSAGTPERTVLEITRLQVKPWPKSDDVDLLRTARAERNRQIIKLAGEAIEATHNVPGKQQVFTTAVHHLMEARMQLALAGEQSDIDALYEDAASLYERDPSSKAAVEAAYALAKFAHTNARRYAQQEPRWLAEFSRQARMFAMNFPQEQTRAVSLLFAAGWSCELHRLRDEAVQCYTLLQEKFPESPQAQQSVAILRRLHLAGKPMELAGPTIDGGYVRIDDYRGKVVLVSFWATDSQSFVEQLPLLTSAAAKFGSSNLAVIGVNLDEEEPPVDAFLANNSITWPQIFYADREKRRWNNPLVKYYGVRDIPMLWLIDRYGNVVNTLVDPGRLDEEIRALLASGGSGGREPM